MKKLLFVCIENSNRSQMAEAFAKMHGRDRVEAFSAGSHPSGRINPKAIPKVQNDPISILRFLQRSNKL